MTQFYRAFEDKHRGSHETIKQRLQVYLPFILPLRDLYEDCRALDVGCGRGEWLETLVENGFDAIGVDLDEGMLEACQARQLPAEKADALAYLKAMPSDTLSLITGFHIVEHIPFDDLKSLVLEANRVLKPGGLMIFETPNAENLIVGTQNFYLDPTHERPIPHMLLDFLVSFSGFWRSKILRLQENPALADSPTIGLMDVIGGTSPDYAIVAQKDPGELDVSTFQPAFDGTYGLSLQDLATRFESGQTAKMEEHRQLVTSTAEKLNGRLDHVEREYAAMTHQINDARTTLSDGFKAANSSLELANSSLLKVLDETSKNADQWHKEAENRAVQIQAMKEEAAHKDEKIRALMADHHSLADYIRQLKASTSWRLTGPLRKGAVVGKMLVSSPLKTSKRAIKKVLRGILNRPALRKVIKRVLTRFPGVNTRLQALAARLRTEAAVARQPVQYAAPSWAPTPDMSDVPPPPAHLSQNAKAIYQRLNSNDQSKDLN